ncbi:hypothetical protein [Spartinivicinus ruber]|uniref:hypothetical protein n=1 Tax=Spartinivicinus ruber TaxID=2683272 RepID=UPI0013D077A5|nr:hypothetical protein [Spartinivicinus ruber]
MRNSQRMMDRTINAYSKDAHQFMIEYSQLGAATVLAYVDVGIDKQDPRLGFLKDNTWLTVEMTYYF